MPTATAAVLSANHQPYVLDEIEVEHPRRGEVLVQILATGPCHTDLNARESLIPPPSPACSDTRARVSSTRSAKESPIWRSAITS